MYICMDLQNSLSLGKFLLHIYTAYLTIYYVLKLVFNVQSQKKAVLQLLFFLRTIHEKK